MESSSSNPSNDEEDMFIDVPDEFFYDCSLAHDNSDRPSYSHAITPPAAANLRRRKSVSGGKLKYPHLGMGSSSSNEFGETILVEQSDELSGGAGKIDEDVDVTESVKDRFDPVLKQGKDLGGMDSPGEQTESSGKKWKDLDASDSGRDLVDPLQVVSSEKSGESTVTTVTDDRVEESAVSAAVSAPREPSWTERSLLEIMIGLMTKTIEFQVSLMISMITFPPRLCYGCCVFLLDPFGTMKRSKRYVMTRVAEIRNMMLENADPFLSHWFKDYNSMLNFVFKFGWGLFWVIYVGTVLITLLVMALGLGGFVIKHLAEEPLVVKESLTFDYTKNTPEAYVPIISCHGIGCDKSCKQNAEMWKMKRFRIIPQNQKVEIGVLLTLPESEYNRNLGMFQVRVDLVSADGHILASSRHPCMLKFRSEAVRFVQTLLKIAPLVTGYVSETQTLRLKFKGFVEKETPTACVKVMMEQRAEFRPGAGIPELYDASMVLQSDLPFLKRMIWNWRRTLFVWISMSIFTMELLFTLVCCRPLIIPRARHRERIAYISRTSNLMNSQARS